MFGPREQTLSASHSIFISLLVNHNTNFGLSAKHIFNPIEFCPRGVKTSGKDGNKTVVTALYSAAVNKAVDKAEEGAEEDEATEVDVMDAADDGVLLEALSQWAPQDDSAPAEAVKKIR